MTTQEQLEKIIEKSKWRRADRIMSGEIIAGSPADIASTILSAMRIDEDGLCYLLGRRSHLGIPLWEHGVEAIISAIASHAQEIIKFEEE